MVLLVLLVVVMVVVVLVVVVILALERLFSFGTVVVVTHIPLLPPLGDRFMYCGRRGGSGAMSRKQEKDTICVCVCV